MHLSPTSKLGYLSFNANLFYSRYPSSSDPRLTETGVSDATMDGTLSCLQHM